MGANMTRLSMYGNGNLRLHDTIHIGQFFSCRMTRNMNKFIRFCDDVDAVLC